MAEVRPPEPNIILFGAQVGHSPARESRPRNRKCPTCLGRTAAPGWRHKGLRPYCAQCNAYALDHRLPRVARPAPPAAAAAKGPSAPDRPRSRRERRRLKFGGRLPASLSPCPSPSPPPAPAAGAPHGPR